MSRLRLKDRILCSNGSNCARLEVSSMKVKIIRNGKKRGEWAELVFASRANGAGAAVEQAVGRVVGV